MSVIKTIALCSSASFYKKVLEVEKYLKKIGFKVLVPHTAKVMKKTGNFNVADHKTWYSNPGTFQKKTCLMKKHFDLIKKSDAILVINDTKNNIQGYIGGNTLMEMGLAFYLKKPIFLLNPISNKSPFYEEVMGMFPKILDNNLKKLNGTAGK